ncbi:MAG: flagellar hook-basal body complex protein, partial [Planctomycetaceae bacterium]|nr:flagellar hook-basal body complex protein [Planctomycetaceae bacterium]
MGLGLSSAIHIAKMGMGAAEKSINISGTNLANANTIGYKAERPDFISFVEYHYKYGFEPGQGYTAGSNPLQIGMGVELGSVTTDFSQGAFKEGMTNSDIAINGNGFIMAAYPNSSEMYYTRDGALKINADLDLTTNTGLNVMGYKVDDKFRIQTGELVPLRIPIGELHIAEQTELVEIEGMLNAVGDDSVQGTVLQTRPMADLSKSFPEEQKLIASQIPQPQTEGISRATGSSTGGEVAPGNYLYRCVYVDAAGNESDYSAPITAAVAANQDSITLTDLPPVPAGYDSLRLYRAIDPGDPTATATFHRLADLPAPAAAYTDIASSESIAPNPVLQQGRLSQGSYHYYVTYIDAAGNESRPSLISDAFNLNIGGQAKLSNIPTVEGDNPDEWVGRRIYRSTANDVSEFYLVGQINNLDADATLTDRFSDAELTDGTHLEWSPAGRGNAMVTGETKLLDVGNFDGTLSSSNSSVRFIPVFEEGILRFTPNKGGKELRITELEITAETTVNDYLRFLSESFGIQSGGDIPADGGSIGKTLNDGKQGAMVKDGSFYLLGNGGLDNALELDANDLMLYNSSPGSPKQAGINWGQDPNNKQNAIGESKAVDLAVFDSLGAPVSVRLTFTLQSKTETETIYRWYADSSDNQPPEGQAIATGTGLLR